MHGSKVKLDGDVPERRVLDHEGVRVLLVHASPEGGGERLGGGFRGQSGEFDLDPDRAQAPLCIADPGREVEVDAGLGRRGGLRHRGLRDRD
jgi:hypothetical protein